MIEGLEGLGAAGLPLLVLYLVIKEVLAPLVRRLNGRPATGYPSPMDQRLDRLTECIGKMQGSIEKMQQTLSELILHERDHDNRLKVQIERLLDVIESDRRQR